jgi:hypothetical protein
MALPCIRDAQGLIVESTACSTRKGVSMSHVAATRSRAPGSWSYLALAFSLGAAAVWVLAGVVDDGLYVFTGVLGVIGFASGLKARREARRSGARTWPAIVAIGLGGLLGAAVIVAFVAWSAYHLVS